MTYNDVLKEFDKLGIKEDFVKVYEPICSEWLLRRIKMMNDIKDVPGVIFHLLKNLKEGSEEKEYWRKVLKYFMTPDFARERNF